MSLFNQILLNGIIAGSIYALVAFGFFLVYNTCKFSNFAHGAVITFSAYFFYLFFSILKFNFGFSVLFALLFVCLLGWSMDHFVFKQFRRKKASNNILLISSLGLLVLLESLVLLIFGADVKTIGYFKISMGINFFGALITPLQIIIIISTLLIFLGLFVFIKKTKLGKAMRAVSNNRDLAEIVGINSEKIYSWSFIIGSLIAGIAGILIGLEQNLSPTMGTNLIIKGFVVAVIGGISNVYGVILGALLLGLAENFGVWYLPYGYKDAIAFIVLFIFLLFMPNGLLGSRKRK